ncbi:MAG: glycosyltransferase family 39 protein [Pseudomonadota bacterium]|nr:glycosyltransferase family 39 protein [Pseudomonadota bacterium]
MKLSIFIFSLAFIVRLFNLYTSQIDLGTNLIEDELMYWDWSLKKAFTEQSILDQSLQSERMPGAFIFYQVMIAILGEQLFEILIVQIIIDSMICIIIAATAKLLNEKLFIFAGIIAALSPLLIIISAQILSDTIFLLFFSSYLYFFLKFCIKKKEFLLYYSTIFLGLSLYTRVVALPLVFLTIFFASYILYKKKSAFLLVIKIIPIFLTFTFLFSIPLIFNNYKVFNTFSLTSQSGSHLAYWVIPGVLDFEEDETKNSYNMNMRQLSIKLEKENNPFKRSNALKEEAFDTLLSVNKTSIVLAWIKGAFFNTFAPPIMLDKRVRDLNHPSFYENNRNIKKWTIKILSEKSYTKYKIFLLFSFFTALVFTFLYTFGVYFSIKYYFKDLVIFYIINFYFLVITGPVFSPKYIHPILPILIIFQALTLMKLYQFFCKTYQKNKKEQKSP